MVGNRPVIRNDVELRTPQSPPRPWNFAVGDEAAVKNVLFMYALGPFAFEVEGIARGQNSRAGLDLGGRCAPDFVENARFILDVVLGVIALNLVPVVIMFEPDMSARLRIARFGVV